MDELDELTKKELRKVMADEGFSQKNIDWSYKHHNTEGLRCVIRNWRCHQTISEMASKPRNN